MSSAIQRCLSQSFKEGSSPNMSRDSEALDSSESGSAASNESSTSLAAGGGSSDPASDVALLPAAACLFSTLPAGSCLSDVLLLPSRDCNTKLNNLTTRSPRLLCSLPDVLRYLTVAWWTANHRSCSAIQWATPRPWQQSLPHCEPMLERGLLCDACGGLPASLRPRRGAPARARGRAPCLFRAWPQVMGTVCFALRPPPGLASCGCWQSA